MIIRGNIVDILKRSIFKGEDLFERKIKYDIVDLDKTFPEYIIKNRTKLKDWIA